MPTKVVYSTRNVNPFGCVNFVIDALQKKGIAKLIDSKLGTRVNQSHYSFSDVIIAWALANICGAERLEDTNFLKYFFKSIPRLKFSSPDTISRVFQSLSQKSQLIVNGEFTHEINLHDKLNNLLVQMSLKLGLLNTAQKYTLDLDHTVIPTKKYDSKNTYLKTRGYHPGVAFIGKIPVFIEGHGGNTNARFQIEKIISRSINLLKRNGVRIGKFRSDAAGYRDKVLELMDKEHIEFFIRIISSGQLREAISGPLYGRPSKFER